MVKALIFNRSDYGPNASKILDKYGDRNIEAMRIVRRPLQSLTMHIIDVVSLNQFKQRVRNEPYDELFHLSMEVRLEGGVSITVEKTQQVTISMTRPISGDCETLTIAVVPDVSLLDLLNTTEQFMGRSNFFRYSAKDMNCQDFIMGILNANGINTPQYQEFVKQDVDRLFDSYLRKISNTATDIIGRTTVLQEGGLIRMKR